MNLLYSNAAGIRIHYESTDPACLVIAVQTGGGNVMVWGMPHITVTAYFIGVDHVHPLMPTTYFQHDSAPYHKAKILLKMCH